jgi:cystathionine beta-lyase
MRKGTQFIHAGIEPDPATGAVMTPIYQTSTYVQSGPGEHMGYEYARTANPTRTTLERALAAAENGRFATCFSSGMAAIDAIMKLLRPGDEILAVNDLYGGTYRLFQRVFAPLGFRFRFLDMSEAASVAEAIGEHTKLLWLETPTNPLLNIVDIQAMQDLARQQGLWTVVDNTFASPYLQNPLDYGADMVVQSMTKFIGGHSDSVMGAVITNDEGLESQLKFLQNSAGAVPGPQDCFLMLRGLKTLHLRMRQHCENARQLAHYLNQHPKVAGVLYPGLPEHKGHEIAKRQMHDYGGMVCFYTKGDTLAEATTLLKSTRLFTLAESLGGVESLIGHPATMTHAAIPREERLAAGLRDSMMRLSVGIEACEDLQEDLEQALAKI